MKPKTLILMLVAVGCGLVAMFLAMKQGDVSAKLPDGNYVVVAQVQIPAGKPITEPEKMLMVKKYADGTEPPGSYSKIETLKDKVLSRTIEPNMPVTEKDLSMASNLFLRAPAGYRALTFRTDLENSIHGHVLPGTYVDLVCSVNTSKGMLTKTFMQNVLVLAINTIKDQNTQNGNKENTGTVNNPVTATLAVKPDEAERVLWVRDRTRVSLVMRAPGDDKVVRTPGVVQPFDELDNKDGAAANKDKNEEVPVARHDILPGASISPEDFELINVPASFAAMAIKDRNKLNGHVAHFVAKGFPITSAHFEALPGGTPSTSQASSTWTPHILKTQVGSQQPRVHKFDPLGRSIEETPAREGGNASASAGGSDGRPGPARPSDSLPSDGPTEKDR
jgi:Flp pilus assembly protein CpaB